MSDVPDDGRQFAKARIHRELQAFADRHDGHDLTWTDDTRAGAPFAMECRTCGELVTVRFSFDDDRPH